MLLVSADLGSDLLWHNHIELMIRKSCHSLLISSLHSELNEWIKSR